MKNHYTLLKISPDSCQKDIEAAFEKFKISLLNYNPGARLENEDIKSDFPDVWEAYHTLSEPSLRKEYDQRFKTDSHFKSLDQANIHNEVQIITYAPTWFVHRFPRIFSYFGFGVAALMLILIIPIVITEPVYTDRTLRLIFYFIFVLALLILLYHFDKIVKRIFYPVREIIFKNNEFYIKYPDSSEELIHKIVLYKYLFLDILYINAFTQTGRKGFYHSLQSYYHIQLTRQEIIEKAKKSSTQVKESYFLFINHWLEKE